MLCTTVVSYVVAVVNEINVWKVQPKHTQVGDRYRSSTIIIMNATYVQSNVLSDSAERPVLLSHILCVPQHIRSRYVR